jgi:hypothetical protein
MPLPALLAPLATAGLSALGGYLGNKLTSGSNSRSNSMGMTRQFPLLSGQQQGAQNALLQQVSPLLQQQQRMFDFSPIAEQARTNFEQRTIPSIAERFTGLNAQGSSAFKQSLGQAGANLEQSLAALQAGYGLQQQQLQQNLLANLLRFGLMPSFETAYTPQQPGFMEGLAPTLGQGIGQLGSLAALKYLGLM